MQNILVRPEVGDIIIFPDPKGIMVGSRPITITHRIVEISGDSIKTKGDNNDVPDSWTISKNEILGKAVILNRKPVVLEGMGGYFLHDFRTYYNAQHLAIAKTIQYLKTMGIVVFFICVVPAAFSKGC